MPEVKTGQFTTASAAAMLDPQLRRALDRVGVGFDVARRNAIEEVTSEAWEEWREEARNIKIHTLDHLDYYLELLHDNVTAAGGQVHFAADAAEANAIVGHLVQTRGVKVATKSKSMVSEELELNPVLESLGVDVYETDLGEYIIQLAGETPSHLVAPALHKSKEDVAELFTDKLGVPYDEDIEVMAATARVTLRDKFMEADLGISGANFVVAETGTLVIVTNEGNGRLCTSAPRIHIGITGMEKVIPSMQDLAIFLRLLPRSATGQRISSYVSMITGPRREDDEDGPEEFHLVLVDNGRSRMLRDPKLREALYCIRCGACLNICPVYQRVGGHSYGWVYPGPIGAVVSPMLTGLKEAKALPQASSLCGACREACPVKINIPRMLLELRHRTAEGENPEEKASSRSERFMAGAYGWLMSDPGRMAFASGIGRIAQQIMPGMPKRDARIRKAPLPLLSKWTQARDLPPLPPKSFRQIWRDELGSDEAKEVDSG
ncbi:MAG: iron-sulfur cluster-binding protein, partial [Chloroflexi bacterium]|nr:iron-sulfur cluster-binding protein [Chloroflexota bacterium]